MKKLILVAAAVAGISMLAVSTSAEAGHSHSRRGVVVVPGPVYRPVMRGHRGHHHHHHHHHGHHHHGGPRFYDSYFYGPGFYQPPGFGITTPNFGLYVR